MNFINSHFYNILKYATVAVTIGLISLLFPSTIGFKYTFQEGQIWPYEDLVAPFDFPISKELSQISQERSTIINSFIPYYTKDVELVKDMKADYVRGLEELVNEMKVAEVDSELLRNTLAYKNKGTSIIEAYATSGIVDVTQTNQDTSDSKLVNLIIGNNIIATSKSAFKTMEDALSEVPDELMNTDMQDADLILPIINNAIVPNVFYDKKRSDNILNEQLSSISETEGIVKQGQLVVAHNGYITGPIYQKLLSYEQSYENNSLEDKTTIYIFLGYLLLTTLVVASFLFFLQFNAKHIYDRYLSVLLMLMLILVYAYLVNVIEGLDDLSPLIIPFCIIPILGITFFSDRVAFFLHVIIVLIASFLSDLGYEFTFLQIFAGIVTILTFKATRYWGSFFKSVLFILLASLAAYFGLSLLREGNPWTIDYQGFVWIMISSFLTLLAFPLIPLIERIFGFTSHISLSEMSDMNRPLLKRLSNEAPGTFQHSLQVSNMAESAAEEIGADALLVKVASLYHDIGKLKYPEYFIENQSGYNPHNEINEKESAKIIISHVTEGVTMAKAARLPSVIIDFIESHHGTTRVEYFYQNYRNKFTDEVIKVEDFTYPGPKPKTREQAIMMLADSLEASSKSLKSPTGVEIDNLVNSIIEGKINNGQLSECNLSFQDLEDCKRVFMKILRSIHHVRIEYPEQQKEKTK